MEIIEITEETVLDIWKVVSDYIPAAKRNDVALRYLQILIDSDVDIDDLSSIHGSDDHLDYALEELSDEHSVDDEDDDYLDEE